MIPPISNHSHTHSRSDRKILQKKREGIYFSKTRLLPFDPPAPAYHLQKLLESLIIIITFDSFFIIFYSVVHTCINIKYPHNKINISSPLLKLHFKVTNFNIFYTSPTHHLHTRTLTYGIVSQKMTYLHPFDHTNILRLCPALHRFYITSISLSHV